VGCGQHAGWGQQPLPKYAALPPKYVVLPARYAMAMGEMDFGNNLRTGLITHVSTLPCLM
jgi:hypothetical protein